MNTPSPTPSHVVVVGSFNVDHVWRCDALPVAGATIAGRYANGPGGKGFNQAIAAVRTANDGPLSQSDQLELYLSWGHPAPPGARVPGPG